jgi:hypothetical protein
MRIVYVLLLISCIHNLNSQVINTIVSSGSGFSGDGGPAVAAKLKNPTGVVFDKNGNLYIADASNNRIRKVTAGTGIIETIAGNGTPGYTGDGGPAAAALLNGPWGIALDTSGTIYIADAYNNCIRKVDVNTGIINTIAGNGSAGFNGDGGLAASASLFWPQGLVLDPAGNLYISDVQNNRIRKVSASSGIITTIAGNGGRGFNGDGINAINASLFYPWGLALDGRGNLYIADEGNSRIREIALITGIISTIAGGSSIGHSGDGGAATAAELSSPGNLTFDHYRNLFISDEGNNCIRKIDSIGIISTIAGNGLCAYTGDGAPAILAGTAGQGGLALDPSGDLCFAEFGTCRIREIGLKTSNSENLNLQAGIYPNPTTGLFYIETNATFPIAVQIFDMRGRLVLNRTITGNVNLDISTFQDGVYNVCITGNDQRINKRLVLIR